MTRLNTVSAYLAAATFAAAAFAAPATAEEWPTRPVRMLVGFGPGGGTDLVARAVAEGLSDVLGQRFYVENRPGAGGSIAADSVAKGAKDGYTILMVSGGHTVTAVMIKALGHDPVKDFAPVGMVANSAFVIVAPKQFEANDVPSLIALAKKAPKTLNVGTVGVGSTPHFASAVFSEMAGNQVNHIPYKITSETIAALRRNELSYAFELAHAVAGQVQAGEMKILATAGAKRWPSLPDVPTIAESGVPGYDVVAWYGLLFAAGTPQAIIDRTHAALKKVLEREDVRKQLQNVGAAINLTTPAELRKHMEEEVARWREVARKANLEPK
jgi:tripartite-type tricarboxylate transporter receptor subunit TctC